MGTLAGRTIVVTGASRGLGRALALAAAREGAAIAVCARGGEALEVVAEACRAQGADVVAVLADMSDARDVERFAATVLERFGELTSSSTMRRRLVPLRPRNSPTRPRARSKSCSAQM